MEEVEEAVTVRQVMLESVAAAPAATVVRVSQTVLTAEMVAEVETVWPPVILLLAEVAEVAEVVRLGVQVATRPSHGTVPRTEPVAERVAPPGMAGVVVPAREEQGLPLAVVVVVAVQVVRRLLGTQAPATAVMVVAPDPAAVGFLRH